MVLARVVIHVLAHVLPHVLARALLHVLARVIIHVHDYYSKTCVLAFRYHDAHCSRYKAEEEAKKNSCGEEKPEKVKNENSDHNFCAP